MRRDFRGGCDPDAFPAPHARQHILKVPNAMGMADQPGVDVQDQMPAAPAAVGKKLIEGFGHSLTPTLGAAS